MDFQWIPLTEPDQNAIERMIKAFPKPTSPMLNSNTMGGLHYHTIAFEDPAQTLELKFLIDLIDDISSGITTIGFYNDYKEWFLYVLPFAINRSHEGRLEPVLANLIATFFNIYRDGLVEEYDVFRQDILDTLAVGLMKPEFWDEDGDFQIEYFESTLPAYFYQASKTLSAAMFFCLRLLTPTEITSWVKSLLIISGPHWRNNFMVWLINADKFFEANLEPFKPFRDYLDDLGLGWFANVTLKIYADEFTPKSTYDLFRSQIFQQLTPELFLEWVAEISENPEVNNDNQITGLPEIFFDRFYSR